MKVLRIEVTNFASYEHLSLELEQGLTLVSGATGSGKSTLCDIVPWVLFGKTAKNGSVEDIVNWSSDHAAEGSIDIEVKGQALTIVRTRGKKAKDNDLYYTRYDGQIRRGKDLVDTQIIINDIVGVSMDLYLSGAYIHEFSQAASFFTLSPKNRRQITEQLADLSLPITISQNLSEYKKEVAQSKEAIELSMFSKNSQLQQIDKILIRAKQNLESWNETKKRKINTLLEESIHFQKYKSNQIKNLIETYTEEGVRVAAEIAKLDSELRSEAHFIKAEEILNNREAALGNAECEHCGAVKHQDKRLLINKQRYALQKEKASNDLLDIQKKNLIHAETKREKEHKINLSNLEARVDTSRQDIDILNAEANPYTDMVDNMEIEKEVLKIELEQLSNNRDKLAIEVSDLTILSDKISELRGKLINTVTSDLENLTNKFLQQYFETEFRLSLIVEDADKLETNIMKDGSLCSYSQLSKGQRQMLKLCLGASIMECISKHNGVSFNAVFLDEALDGLDDELKVKAFDLLQYIASNHESVFVVEHNQALKSMFDKEYRVTLVNGESQLEKA